MRLVMMPMHTPRWGTAARLAAAAVLTAFGLAACSTAQATDPAAEDWQAAIVPPGEDLAAGMEVYTFNRQTEADGETVTEEREYLLYVPEAYFDNPDEPWPLVVFLHGSGEKGVNARRLVGVPPFRAITLGETDYPFIVAAPQLGFAEDWVSSTGLVYDLLQHLRGELSIDPDRITISGFSLGGQGVWAFASAYPELPAGLVSTAGFWFVDGASAPPNLCEFAATPIFLAHSEADEAVPYEGSAAVVEAWDACRPNDGELWFETYSDLTHAETAPEALFSEDLVKWILERRRE